jgi:hypothetical protein
MTGPYGLPHSLLEPKLARWRLHNHVANSLKFNTTTHVVAVPLGIWPKFPRRACFTIIIYGSISLTRCAEVREGTRVVRRIVYQPMPLGHLRVSTCASPRCLGYLDLINTVCRLLAQYDKSSTGSAGMAAFRFDVAQRCVSGKLGYLALAPHTA